MLSKLKKYQGYFFVFLISLAINFLIIDYKKSPVIFPDSGSYINIAKQINKHEWPDFSMRTPTYPLYLSIFTPTNNLLLSVYFNAIIGALGSVLLLWISLQFIPSVFLASIITIFITSDLGIINYQSTILTESIAPALMLFCLFANLQIIKNKKINFFGFFCISLADLLIMFLKPTFIILPLILKIIYLLITYLFPKIIPHSKRKSLVVLSLINLVFILSFIGYNYTRIGKFQISTLKQINTFGKLIGYGYLDSSKLYPDAPPELLTAIETYSKYTKPDKSPYLLLNLLEKDKKIKNTSIFLNETNKYLLSKNKPDFVLQTLLLIPINFNLRPSLYSQPSIRAQNNPIIKTTDLTRGHLYSSNLYAILLCLFLLTKMIINTDTRSILLGSMLLFCFFTVSAISFFSYSEFQRLRQPIDILLNLFLFLPFYYIFTNKNKK